MGKVFSVDLKPRLGVDIDPINWNTLILAYHVRLSNGMTDRKKTETPEKQF